MNGNKMNKKAKEPVWEIIEWIAIILVIIMAVSLILRFNIIEKIKDLFPSFGK